MKYDDLFRRSFTRLVLMIPYHSLKTIALDLYQQALLSHQPQAGLTGYMGFIREMQSMCILEPSFLLNSEVVLWFVQKLISSDNFPVTKHQHIIWHSEEQTQCVLEMYLF